MIVIENLNKSFGKQQVLFNVNLKIEDGLITSIGGPNGSGKTTLIKSILGLVNYTDGNIFINNQNIKQYHDYKKTVGYMPQIGRYPDNLTVNEVLNMVIDIRNCKSHKKDEFIEMFNLEPSLKKQMRTLSGGTRQKVSATLSLMFSPEILIFDEPTTGLDPISSGRLKQYILNEKQNYKTIILISHIFSEIEELSDRFVYILDGNIIIEDTINSLLEKTEQNSLEKSIAELIK